jgi:hypothetical protein
MPGRATARAPRAATLRHLPFRERATPPLDQRVEALRVQLTVRDPQEISAALRDEAPVNHRFAKAGNQVVQAPRCRRRRRFSPQRVDQAVARDRLVRVQQQDREQYALAPLGERDGLRPLLHLERPQDAVLQIYAATVTQRARLV